MNSRQSGPLNVKLYGRTRYDGREHDATDARLGQPADAVGRALDDLRRAERRELRHPGLRVALDDRQDAGLDLLVQRQPGGHRRVDLLEHAVRVVEQPRAARPASAPATASSIDSTASRSPSIAAWTTGDCSWWRRLSARTIWANSAPVLARIASTYDAASVTSGRSMIRPAPMMQVSSSTAGRTRSGSAARAFSSQRRSSDGSSSCCPTSLASDTAKSNAVRTSNAAGRPAPRRGRGSSSGRRGRRGGGGAHCVLLISLV